jgi:hypothetical protein|tara:strand:- start:33 stop:719 length:687 start_codon:yes stop_codon:yes gene_type:complete
MAEVNTGFRINDVEALWPRINRCYRFDNSEKRSVPCDASDDGAKYEISFRMDKPRANELWSAMLDAYKAKAATQDSWPKKFDNPFKKDDGGTFIFKASLKGAYGKEVTRKPTQYDSRNTELDADFMLTTGSTVNIAVTFTPYHASMGTGVSLRLRAVQVIKYALLESRSPFDTAEGFAVSEDVSPFANGIDIEEVEEEEKEPVKVSKKAAVRVSKKPELDALVDAWEG